MALTDEQEAALKKQLADMETDRDKWKGFSRQHEDRAKENAAAAEELKQLKASSQTDQQKRDQADKDAAKKLEDLEQRANASDLRALRAEVASEKGLTSAQAKRLAGTTREELEADADDLLETFPSSSKGDDGSGTEKTRPATRPKTNVSGGGDPTEGAAVEMDPAKLTAGLPRY